ncbi:MAG: hypothetical protein M3619_19200 [Myxococcota bacterium]|nr:hypothetical protein [Myxococcota bacterium]
MAEIWKKCTECRKEIAFGATYWQCSVSTCNRSRMPLVFCSVICWDSHLSTVRHRDAGAIEAKAPSQESWQREQASQPPEPVTPAAAPGRSNSAPAVTSRPSSSAHSAMPSRSPSSFETAGRREGPTPDSVQATRPRSDETRPHAAPPPPAQAATPSPPVRRVIEAAPAQAGSSAAGGPHLADIVDRDMLVVISKLKKYIKDRSGMNCSDAVAEVMSDHLRAIADDSIRAAARDERKTVLDRDVPRPRLIGR